MNVTTAAGPTFSQIKAQVMAIRKKIPHARVIGIRSMGRWNGEVKTRDGENMYFIHQCDSPLAMRLALRESIPEDATRILVTNVDDREVSEDILLRLEKRRFFPIDHWQTVRSLFQASSIDHRLTTQPWIVESLLELVPSDAYPAAQGGFVDVDTVWSLLLQHGIGFTTDIPDVYSLLKWSLDSKKVERYRNRPSDFRNGMLTWLTEKAGPVVKLILAHIEKHGATDAVPLGIAASVIFHEKGIHHLGKSAGKFEERYVSGVNLEAALARRWAESAVDVVRPLKHSELALYHQIIQRSDEILRDLQADGYAYLSDLSRLGFDQRMARLGRMLLISREGSLPILSDLLEGLKSLTDHQYSTLERRRIDRVRMAIRLVRWMEGNEREGASSPKSFVEAVNSYVKQGSFLDWARLSLRLGDPVRELTESYTTLFETITKAREKQSKRFAQLLADWTRSSSHSSEVIPIERVLDEVVAPLSAQQPVLLIVLDGMSVAVCHELMEDLLQFGWSALCEEGRNAMRSGVAMVPSVTEFSRASLLCGRKCQGSAAEERNGFQDHPSLLKNCRKGSPPVLFHKAALQASNDVMLADDIRNEIASSTRQVVGVVINAIDDHLAKGDQIATRWSRDEIKALPLLLHEASAAKRLVILVSDHGHILDSQTTEHPFDRGERWRSSQGSPSDGELAIEGTRVIAEGGRLIAPWSEKIRYGVKKNGYHGGLSPQEIVIPIRVLINFDKAPKGWDFEPIHIPTWWDLSPSSLVPEETIDNRRKAKVPVERLFDDTIEEEQLETLPAVSSWIEAVLSSPLFEGQKKLAGRNPPASEDCVRFLLSLEKAGGKMTMLALTRAMGWPTLRMPGLVAKMQRLLNVDGYAVVSRDESSDTIALDKPLLLKQFEIE